MKITGVVAIVAAAASVVSGAPLESRASDNMSLGSINTGTRLGNGALQVGSNVLGTAAGTAANILNTGTDIIKNVGGRLIGSNGNRNGFSPLSILGMTRSGRFGF